MSVADLSMLAREAADELALRAAEESSAAKAALHALLRRLAEQVAIAEDTTPRTVLDEAFKAAPADQDWNRWAAVAGAPAQITPGRPSGLHLTTRQEWP